jgi:TonB family protein
MQRGVKISLVLHTIFIILIIFGLPEILKKTVPKQMSVSVELVPIKDFANIKTKKKTEIVKDDKPDEAKTIVKAAHKEEEEQKKPEVQELKKDSRVEPKEELPKPEAEPIKKIEKKEVKKEEPKKDEKKDDPKKDVKKEEPKKDKPKKKEKKHNFDPDSLLKSLEDSADKKTDKATKNETKAKLEELDEKDTKGTFDPSQELSMSEEDIFRNQIYNNWSIPSGAKEGENNTVLVRITIEKDGSVTNVEVISGNKGNNPTFYQAFVDSAIRAIKKSSPFKDLPADKYDNWHVIQFNFDPKEML